VKIYPAVIAQSKFENELENARFEFGRRQQAIARDQSDIMLPSAAWSPSIAERPTKSG
jgi:hypothetical protein